MLRCRAVMGESFLMPVPTLHLQMPSPLEMAQPRWMPLPPVRTLQQGY